MMLAEEGAFELKDPVSRVHPGLRRPRGCTAAARRCSPRPSRSAEPMRIWHLLTHTSGLTYGFHHSHPVDAMYRAAGFEWGSPPGLDTGGCVRRVGRPAAAVPARHRVELRRLHRRARAAWSRSCRARRSTSSSHERIFGPLGMVDTGFPSPTAQRDRLASLYVANPADGQRLKFDALGAVPTEPPPFLSGGGGLVSTAADYLRFAEMLRRGGELDGVRLLGSRTVRVHGQQPPARRRRPRGASAGPLFCGDDLRRRGLRPRRLGDGGPRRRTRCPARRASFGWGGAASTFFCGRPGRGHHRRLFLTQLLPSIDPPDPQPSCARLVRQALVD